MLLDRFVFLGGERPRLHQHLIADPDFADVVKQRAETQHLELRLVQRQLRPIASETALTRSEWPAVYGSRASSANASARIAPTYASRVSASAAASEAITVLKVAARPSVPCSIR